MPDIETKRVLILSDQPVEKAKEHYAKYGWNVLSETMVGSGDNPEAVQEHYVYLSALEIALPSTLNGRTVPCLSLVRESTVPDLEKKKEAEAVFIKTEEELESFIKNAQNAVSRGQASASTRSYDNKKVLVFAIFFLIAGLMNFGVGVTFIGQDVDGKGVLAFMIVLGVANFIVSGFLFYKVKSESNLIRASSSYSFSEDANLYNYQSQLDKMDDSLLSSIN